MVDTTDALTNTSRNALKHFNGVSWGPEEAARRVRRAARDMLTVGEERIDLGQTFQASVNGFVPLLVGGLFHLFSSAFYPDRYAAQNSAYPIVAQIEKDRADGVIRNPDGTTTPEPSAPDASTPDALTNTGMA